MSWKLREESFHRSLKCQMLQSSQNDGIVKGQKIPSIKNLGEQLEIDTYPLENCIC